MEGVAARLGDDADLPACARAVFGGIVIRLDAELLDILETRLELERSVVLAVHVAGRGVNDGRTLDTVVTNHVLLNRAAGEPDVLPRAGAGVLRSRRLQQ
jgi:hypothetical protein